MDCQKLLRPFGLDEYDSECFSSVKKWVAYPVLIEAHMCNKRAEVTFIMNY